MPSSRSWWQSVLNPFGATKHPRFPNEDDGRQVEENPTTGDGRNVTTDITMQHVLQQSNWDCGVACLLMTWSWLVAKDGRLLNREELDQQRTHLLNILATQSIWTMDLVYALHQMATMDESAVPFDFLFCSVMFEANSDWKEYSYYANEFDKDQQRTRERLAYLRQERPSSLFQYPQQSNNNTKPSISWVMERIQDDSEMAILLVDLSTLNSCRNSSKPSSASGYAGHYLLITGIQRDDDNHPNNENSDVFLTVYNPNAERVGVDYMLARHVEAAWQAPGTDQDVIFIRKLQS